MIRLPPIYVVLTVSFVDAATVKAANVLLVLYALEFGAQPFTVGLLAATFCAFSVIVSVPAGKFADRFGSRWLLVLASLIGSGMLIPYLVPGLPAVFLAAAMVGVFDGIFVVLAQNLVGLLSTEETRARNYSNYSLTGSAASLLAPLMVGFSIDLSGHALACLYLTIWTLAGLPLLLVWGWLLPAGTGKVRDKQGGIRAMLADSAVRAMLAASSFHIAGNYMYQVYLPVYAHSLALSASVIGMILAVNGIAEITVRVALPHMVARFKENAVLAAAMYLGAASLILMPFVEHAVLLALVSFTFGLGMGCAGPIITILLFAYAPTGRSGEVLGFRMAVNFATKMASPLVFGAIASAAGLFHIFWINALVLGSGGRLSQRRKK